MLSRMDSKIWYAAMLPFSAAYSKNTCSRNKCCVCDRTGISVNLPSPSIHDYSFPLLPLHSSMCQLRPCCDSLWLEHILCDTVMHLLGCVGGREEAVHAGAGGPHVRHAHGSQAGRARHCQSCSGCQHLHGASLPHLLSCKQAAPSFAHLVSLQLADLESNLTAACQPLEVMIGTAADGSTPHDQDAPAVHAVTAGCTCL